MVAVINDDKERQAYLERRREYYKRNKDRIRAQNERWNEVNIERKRAAARAYAAACRADPLFVEHAKLKAKIARAKPENKTKARAAFKEWTAKNPDYNREYIRRRAGRDPAKHLFWLAKQRAARRGVPFTIMYEDVVIPTHCPVLGLELRLGHERGRADHAPSIDRKIPHLGYVKGNIEVISMRANWLKGNGTADELRRVAAYAARCEDN